MLEIIGLNITYNKERIYGLDILRAFSILTVVISHTYGYLTPFGGQILQFFCYDGVSFFFVLSGFLIGGILIRQFQNQELNIKSLFLFWCNRWFRTLPPYYLFLSLYLILLNFSSSGVAPTLKKYYFFLQNLTYKHPTFFIEAWSLSVEEWFYFLFPITIFIIIKILKITFSRTLIFVSFAFILFSIIIRYTRSNLIIDNNDFEFLIRMQVVTRLDSLMYGVLGAFLFINFSSMWSKYRYILFIIGLVLLNLNKYYYMIPVLNNSLYKSVFFLIINGLGALFLLPLLSQIKKGTGKIYQFLTHISLISYSMYLLNLSIIQDFIMVHFQGLNSFGVYGKSLLVSSYLIITFILATLSYKYFEQPSLKYLRLFFLKNKK